jgi:hypothetical protein
VTLIEILLPLAPSSGGRQEDEVYADLRRLLVERFGGLTAFTRSPAEGVWVDPKTRVQQDTIVVLEVMADYIDHTWWAALRQRLEQKLGQDRIVIRASQVETL